MQLAELAQRSGTARPASRGCPGRSSGVRILQGMGDDDLGAVPGTTFVGGDLELTSRQVVVPTRTSTLKRIGFVGSGMVS